MWSLPTELRIHLERYLSYSPNPEFIGNYIAQDQKKDKMEDWKRV